MCREKREVGEEETTRLNPPKCDAMQFNERKQHLIPPRRDAPAMVKGKEAGEKGKKEQTGAMEEGMR